MTPCDHPQHPLCIACRWILLLCRFALASASMNMTDTDTEDDTASMNSILTWTSSLYDHRARQSASSSNTRRAVILPALTVCANCGRACPDPSEYRDYESLEQQPQLFCEVCFLLKIAFDLMRTRSQNISSQAWHLANVSMSSLIFLLIRGVRSNRHRHRSSPAGTVAIESDSD